MTWNTIASKWSLTINELDGWIRTDAVQGDGALGDMKSNIVMWPSGMLPSLSFNKLTNIKILEKESNLRHHIQENLNISLKTRTWQLDKNSF